MSLPPSLCLTAALLIINCYVGIDCGQLSIDQLHYGVPSKWDSEAANTPEFIPARGSMAAALKALFWLCPPPENLCPGYSMALSRVFSPRYGQTCNLSGAL